MKRPLSAFYREGVLEAGCDEAGRGCLAGPVVAAAVILPAGYHHALLNDSKQLTAKQRAALRPVIEAEAVDWAVASVSPEEIDRMNILNASFLAMSRAVQQLKAVPEHLLIDGNRFKTSLDIPYTCMVKGDARFLSIAAASVLAKTWRDAYMEQIDQEFPEYRWMKNRGYPTREHYAAIARIGITVHHRRSFKLFHDQLKLPF